MAQPSTVPNRLSKETSPYLQQHAHNPVDWYPWGGEALARAKADNKPVLLSIGYSACHWCHVMEKESFENEAIAALMNEKFVNIKVDREERPAAMNRLTRVGESQKSFDQNIVGASAEKLAEAYDPEHGGFGQAPKFPNAGVYELYLRAYTKSKNQRFLGMIEHTLRAMAE